MNQIQLVLDTPLPAVASPMVAIYRRFDQFVTDPNSQAGGCLLVPQVGWQLSKSNFDVPNPDSSTSDLGVFKVADASLETTDQFADVNLSTSVAPITFQRRTIPSGGNWSEDLASDVTLFPYPNPGLIRVAVSSANHDPNQAVRFEYRVQPTPSIGSAESWLRLYFCGPAGRAAGETDSNQGLGQYYLEVAWNSASLFERCADSTWKMRRQMNRGLGAYSTRALEAGNYVVTVNTVSTANQAFIHIVAGSGIGQEFTVAKYAVPSPSPPTPTKLRIDIPADHRPTWRLRLATYVPSATLTTDPLSLDHPTGSHTPLTLAWFGSFPVGTSVEATLVNAETGEEVTPSASTLNQSSGSCTYTIPNLPGRPFGSTHFQFRFLLTTIAPNLTPNLVSFSLTKAPELVQSIGAQFTVPKLVGNTITSDLERVTAVQPGIDPTKEISQIRLIDYASDLSPLATSGEIQAQLRLVNPISGNYSVLAHGHCMSQASHRLKPNQMTRYSVKLVGEWSRLATARLPQSLRLDPSSYVVDVVRLIFNATGYPDSMLDIPSSTILNQRLSNLVGDEYVFEPYGPALDQVSALVRDYFGGEVLFDPNAGSVGVWRVVLPPRSSTSNPLCCFWRRMLPGTLRLAQSANYDSAAAGAIDNLAAAVPRINMLRGSLNEWTEAPRATSVYVVGGTVSPESQSAAGVAWPSLISRWAVNTDAYNPFSLAVGDPGFPNTNRSQNPDYVGFHRGLVHQDFTLQTQGAVDRVCRRIFESECTSRINRKFRSAMILVTDPADSIQSRPRPLRLYDEVWAEEADGSFRRFVVADVKLIIEKASQPIAEYHLVAAPTVANTLAGPRARSIKELLVQTIRQSRGTDVTSRLAAGINRDADSRGGRALSYGAAPTLPIQDLDPASPTFGQFTGPIGYV